MEEWKTGVAFVKGINMFSCRRLSKEEMLLFCRKIEGDKIKIVDVVGADNIIFMKKDIHYATVGRKLEEVLSKHFNEKVCVTTRSMRTMERIMERWYKNGL